MGTWLPQKGRQVLTPLNTALYALSTLVPCLAASKPRRLLLEHPIRGVLIQPPEAA